MLFPLSEPVPLAPGVVARVQHVEQASQTPPPERFLHFHGPAELVLIEKGSGRFLCDNGLIPFSSGAILFAPAMAVHDFDFDTGARAWTLLQFDPHVLDRHVMALPASPRGFALDPAQLDRVRILLDWLSETIGAQSSSQIIAIQLQALILAIAQIMGPDDANHASVTSSLSRFRPLLDHLSKFPIKDLTLAEAASRCAMSPAYFSRCFAKTFGSGFIAYQTRLRVQQAARVIATSNEPISQIGYRLGFRSPAYFAHCFRSVFGVTPSAHRIRNDASLNSRVS